MFALLHLLTLASATLASPLIAQYWPAYTSVQTPSEIPWSTTDIAYYFVTVTTAQGLSLPDGQSTADIASFVSNAHQNGAKAVYTVGGWTGGIYFSDLVTSDSARTSFAGQLNDFMTKYGFDGVDIDWEYPNGAGIGCNHVSASDSANFLLFLQKLKSTIASGKLITAAVSPTGFLGPDGNALTDYSAYGKVLDYLNVMTYDITGSWSATTGPNAPLHTCNADSSVDDAVTIWTAGNFPASKILIGIPSYAHSFTTTSSTLSSTTVDGFTSMMYQAKTSTTPKGDSSDVSATSTDICGTTTSGFSGQWEYKTLISGGVLSADGTTGAGGYERFYDNCTQTPFLFNKSTKEFVSYEDATSVAAKAEYATKKGLAGVMIFDSTGFNDQVLSAIKSALGGSSSAATPASVALAATAPAVAASPSFSSTITAKPASTSGAVVAAGSGESTSTDDGDDLVCDDESDDESTIAETPSATSPVAAASTTAPQVVAAASATIPTVVSFVEPSAATAPAVAVDSSSSSVDFTPGSVTSTFTSTSAPSSSTSYSISVAQGATLRCDSLTTFSICDGDVCHPMGNVAAGTQCVNGAIAMAPSKRLSKKHKKSLALERRMRHGKHMARKRWF